MWKELNLEKVSKNLKKESGILTILISLSISFSTSSVVYGMESTQTNIGKSSNQKSVRWGAVWQEGQESYTPDYFKQFYKIVKKNSQDSQSENALSQKSLSQNQTSHDISAEKKD